MAKTSAVMAMTGCLALSGGLSGCVAHFGGPGRASVRLGVPIVRQGSPDGGGLASARMLSRYYGQPLAPRAERLMMLASATGDLDSEELKAALEASGFRVTLASSELPAVYAHLDRGEPVVVVVASTFMLVDGYGQGRLVLLDPRRGVLRPEASDFDLVWRGSRRLALVAVK